MYMCIYLHHWISIVYILTMTNNNNNNTIRSCSPAPRGATSSGIPAQLLPYDTAAYIYIYIYTCIMICIYIYIYTHTFTSQLPATATASTNCREQKRLPKVRLHDCRRSCWSCHRSCHPCPHRCAHGALIVALTPVWGVCFLSYWGGTHWVYYHYYCFRSIIFWKNALNLFAVPGINNNKTTTTMTILITALIVDSTIVMIVVIVIDFAVWRPRGRGHRSRGDSPDMLLYALTYRMFFVFDLCCICLCCSLSYEF